MHIYQLNFLGNTISQDDIIPIQDKVNAIANLTIQTSLQQLIEDSLFLSTVTGITFHNV